MEKKQTWYFNNRERNIEAENDRRIIHKNEIDELNNKIQILTQTLEMLKSTISTSEIIAIHTGNINYTSFVF